MLQGKYPLLIALVLGLLAGVIAYSAIKARESEVRVGWETARILCAATDIVEGTELDGDMVARCEIPEKFITDSFIRIPDGDSQGEMMPYGQKVLVPLKAGDPVLYSHFESQRDFALSEGIPTKARAIAIEVGEKASVNQWIRPNDHVDVIGTFRDTETRELIAVTLLENLIVLATGHHSGMSPYMTDEDKRYTHVVLLVMSEEAEILALAAETGSLTLTLRNPRDLDVVEKRTTKTDQKTLLTGERSALLRAERAKTWQRQEVEIITGSSSKKQQTGQVRTGAGE